MIQSGQGILAERKEINSSQVEVEKTLKTMDQNEGILSRIHFACACDQFQQKWIYLTTQFTQYLKKTFITVRTKRMI